MGLAEMRRGVFFNSMKRGQGMPAFMFEKISPPVQQGVISPVAIKEPRGVIVQMIDRLTEGRLQREARRARFEAGFTEADITPSRTRGE